MVEGTSCCGVGDYDGVSSDSPMKVLNAIACDQYGGGLDGNKAFIMFTDITRNSSVPRIVKIIEEAGLGTITKTESKLNPNSGNRITVWLFGMNHKKFKAWAKKKFPKTFGIGKCEGGDCDEFGCSCYDCECPNCY